MLDILQKDVNEKYYLSEKIKKDNTFKWNWGAGSQIQKSTKILRDH